MADQRINVYVCEYGCNNVTVDVDKGVTPFMMKCKSKPTKERPIEKKFLDEKGVCIGMANSSMYPRGPKPSWIKEPTHEWCLPTKKEVVDSCKDDLDVLPQCLEYYDGTRLFLRERTDMPALFHKDQGRG